MPISLRLREGEILGVAGLVGSGRTEAMRAIFGADRPTAGHHQRQRCDRCRSPRRGMPYGPASAS